jgi:general secretion pathway protein J
MSMLPRRKRRSEAGFTLIEVLMATLLMTVILGALATVTAQWLPNWNRGIVRVQRAERLAMGLDRIAADLSVAEMIPVNADAKAPLFEKADAQGLALVRERTPFTPMPTDAQIRFSDQVVLIRAPFRVTFSYAGPDQVWQPVWRGQMQLPEKIRATVRDGATGQVLNVSTAMVVHVNAPAECARAKNPVSCLTARLNPESQKKEEQL